MSIKGMENTCYKIHHVLTCAGMMHDSTSYLTTNIWTERKGSRQLEKLTNYTIQNGCSISSVYYDFFILHLLHYKNRFYILQKM